MKKLEERLWYGVFVHNSYNVIAQELESVDRDYRRWAAVYIMEHNLNRKDLNDIIKDGVGHKYLFLIIDVAISYIDVLINSWDSDLFDRNIKLIYKKGFEEEETLYYLCKELNVDPERFVTPWKANYIFE